MKSILTATLSWLPASFAPLPKDVGGDFGAEIAAAANLEGPDPALYVTAVCLTEALARKAAVDFAHCNGSDQTIFLRAATRLAPAR